MPSPLLNDRQFRASFLHVDFLTNFPVQHHIESLVGLRAIHEKSRSQVGGKTWPDRHRMRSGKSAGKRVFPLLRKLLQLAPKVRVKKLRHAARRATGATAAAIV